MYEFLSLILSNCILNVCVYVYVYGRGKLSYIYIYIYMLGISEK